MSAETIATVYCCGAIFWFAFLWLGVFAAMKMRHPHWEELEDATNDLEILEGRSARVELFLTFTVNFAFSALTWPWSIPKTVVRVMQMRRR